MTTLNYFEPKHCSPELNKQIAEVLKSWGDGELPYAEREGICMNLAIKFQQYSFCCWVAEASLGWKHHRTGKYSVFPVPNDQKHHKLWSNPKRLDLCRYLAKLLLNSEQHHDLSH